MLVRRWEMPRWVEYPMCRMKMLIQTQETPRWTEELVRVRVRARVQVWVQWQGYAHHTGMMERQEWRLGEGGRLEKRGIQRYKSKQQ